MNEINIGLFDLINEISILNCVQSWFYVLTFIFNESIIPCDVTDQEMYGSSYSIGEDGQLSNLHAQHNAIHQIRELCHK